jgi:hypothetical protein
MTKTQGNGLVVFEAVWGMGVGALRQSWKLLHVEYSGILGFELRIKKGRL